MLNKSILDTEWEKTFLYHYFIILFRAGYLLKPITSTSLWLSERESYVSLTQTLIGWRGRVGVLLHTFSEAQTPPVCNPTVPRALEAWAESCLWLAGKRRETSVRWGSHWKLSWARPGCGTHHFCSYPKRQTLIAEEKARKCSPIMSPAGGNGFSWTHILCSSSPYCGSGVHSHFQDHEKFTSKLPPLYRDFWLSDQCIFISGSLWLFSSLSKSSFWGTCLLLNFGNTTDLGGGGWVPRSQKMHSSTSGVH